MNQRTRTQHPPHTGDCPKARLADSDFAAVDICGCGMLQVHIGALTLRMTPCALSELLSTLGRAVAAHAALQFGESALASGARRERGEA